MATRQSLSIVKNRPVILQSSEIDALIQNGTIPPVAAVFQHPLSDELAFLHELIITGQWTYIEQFLSPLTELDDHTHLLYLVYRQEYIELLMTSSSAGKEERLKVLLEKLSSFSPSKEEYNGLSILLSLSSLSSHPEYVNWTVTSSRDQLYRHLAQFLCQQITSHVATPTSRLVQLISKGLLYEQCQQLLLNRYTIRESLPTDHVLDLLSWLRRLPNGVYDQCHVPNVLPVILHHHPALPTLLPSHSMELETTPTFCEALSKSAPEKLLNKSATPATATPTVRSDTPPLATNSSLVTSNIYSTPPTHLIAPLSSSTPRSSHRRGNQHSILDQPTPIQLRDEEAWPEISLAAVITEKQVIRSLSFSTNGMVAVGINSRTLRVFDSNCLLATAGSSSDSVPGLTERYCQSNYHRGSIYCLDWYKDSSILASGSNDQSIKLLSCTSSSFTVIGDIKDCGGTIRELAFLPSTVSLISCGNGQYPLQLINTQTLAVSRNFKHPNCSLLSLSVINDNTFITGGEDGTVSLWDTRSTRSPSLLHTLSSSVTSLAVYRDSIVCASSSGQCTTLSISKKGGIVNQWSPHKEECRSIRYSPNGQWILSSSYDGTISLTNSTSYQYKVFAHFPDKVIQSRYHPSGHLMASVSANGTASFWKVY